MEIQDEIDETLAKIGIGKDEKINYLLTIKTELFRKLCKQELKIDWLKNQNKELKDENQKLQEWIERYAGSLQHEVNL